MGSNQGIGTLFYVPDYIIFLFIIIAGMMSNMKKINIFRYSCCETVYDSARKS